MKKRIAARSAAIGIRSNDIVGEGGVYKLAKMLNQHFYKLLSIHRLEGGDIYIYIYIYISEGVRSFEQDDGGHNFTIRLYYRLLTCAEQEIDNVYRRIRVIHFFLTILEEETIPFEIFPIASFLSFLTFYLSKKQI